MTVFWGDKLNQVGLGTFTSLPSSNRINKFEFFPVGPIFLSVISKTVPNLAMVLPGAYIKTIKLKINMKNPNKEHMKCKSKYSS